MLVELPDFTDVRYPDFPYLTDQSLEDVDIEIDGASLHDVIEHDVGNEFQLWT